MEKKDKRPRKWTRIAFIALGSLFGLLVLLWLGLALYIRANKATLLQQISQRLSERLHGGSLQIKDMEPSLLRSFPNISVSLNEVSIKDSLWERHRHHLLNVKRVFVKVNTFSLLRKQLDVQQVTLENGAIYLFTDSTGYTNASVLQGRKKKRSGNGRDADITRLQLEDMQFILENRQKQKLFQLDIGSLKGGMDAADTGWTFNMRTSIRIRSFAFNTAKGSYLHNKLLETELQVHYSRPRHTLFIPRQLFRIDGQPVEIGGNFSFAQSPPAFNLHIVAGNIPFASAVSLLSPNISRKLDSIHMQQPLDVEARLQGHMRYRDTPLVHVTWKTASNTISTKGLELSECSFGGSFYNERQPGGGHNDENTIIRLNKLQARCFGMPVSADSVQIVNLKHPVLRGRFRSSFPLSDLNTAGDSSLLNFSGGTASADLYYKGGITVGDTVKPWLQGTVKVQNGAFTYRPRNLAFKDCNVLLAFNGEDLLLQNMQVQSGKSTLLMEGSARNIAGLYFIAPEKITLDWRIRSPMLDLNEFRSFLGKRRSSAARRQSAGSRHRKISRVARQLEVVLDACNVNMQVEVDKLAYQRFNASQVRAGISLTRSDIRLERIALSTAGGSMQLNGSVLPDGGNNRFKLNANINNVHIGQLFYAFDDFGMQSLRSKNLRGILSAKANISGNVRDDGRLAPRSLYGTVSFNLRQGALLNFAPLVDIGDLLFRRRNLDNITFDKLQNTLQLQGSKIIIPPMQINSSALNMDVSGVYGMPTGTDIYLTVPLRNPQKDGDVTDKAEKKKLRRKGIVLHLHATDDKNGKVKIKLGKKKDEEGTRTAEL